MSMRQMPLHAIFGGGKVAHILLWKDKTSAATILAVFTIIWLQLEVLEYQFLTVFCDILMLAMLAIFVWHKGTQLANLYGFRSPSLVSYFPSPPNSNNFQLSESTCGYFFQQINFFLFKFFEISAGKDLKLLVLAMVCLWMFSALGDCVSSVSLLYTSTLLLGTLPALYERYGVPSQVDTFAAKCIQEVKKLFQMFESKVLKKIPGMRKERVN
ncbi:reticulon-like protein B14 [Prunus avium]|uniref:Reticulon-like protein n=1 Tax=Prunus avium TaxID=42229 RepID=A0A6P5TAT8_PRUAV|nr:reticulon-like protein B14 [Prunus avium]